MHVALFRCFLHFLPGRLTPSVKRSWKMEMENPVLDSLAVHWALSSCTPNSCKWMQTGNGMPSPWRPAKELSSTDTQIFPSAINPFSKLFLLLWRVCVDARIEYQPVAVWTDFFSFCEGCGCKIINQSLVQVYVIAWFAVVFGIKSTSNAESNPLKTGTANSHIVHIFVILALCSTQW